MQKTRVTVTIFGRDYAIASEVDPEHIRKAADYLNTRMQEVSDGYPNISENRVAVLAALNIAFELFQSPHPAGDRSDFEERILRLTQTLSNAL